MNNLRLLTGCLVAILSGTGWHTFADTPAAMPQGDVISMEQLFEIAEHNSVQLRPSFSAEEEARLEVNVARSAYLPDIEASLSVSGIGDGFTTARDFSDCQKAPIPHFGNGLSLTVSQPLYAGGAIRSGIEMAELKSTASRFATEMQRDNIRFRLAGFYLDLYKYRNLRTVVADNLQLANRMLADMTARFEQGVALRNDITRYELLVANLELELTRIDNTIDILTHNLAVTAGLPAGTRILPDSTMLLRALPADGEAWWCREAADNAPAIALARTGVEISRKGEALVKSERLPHVGIQAAWSLDGPILVEVPPINRNLSYWYVGLGVTYNVASLYKSNKALARSRAATRVAEEQLDAVMQQTDLTIRADYVRYLEAYEELKTRHKSVELADRNYNVTATRYSADMALITDMLDAANARIEADRELVNSRINIIYYYYKLLFSSGKI
ncbi:MAG: TolC family protein [Muribaculaceae bacterium]|nr:TolC family protein [Muribaculaceae bacterium]